MEPPTQKVNHSSQKNVENVYRTVHACCEQGSKVQEIGSVFRKRLIPATVLGVIAPSILIAYLLFVGLCVYANIQYGWLDPDVEALSYINQRFVSPPVIVQCGFGIASSVCGIVAAFSWMRGRWRGAVTLTASFLLLIMLAIYVGSGMME